MEPDHNLIVTAYRTSSLLINICQSRITLSYAQSTQPQYVHLLFLYLWGLLISPNTKRLWCSIHIVHISLGAARAFIPAVFCDHSMVSPTNQSREADTALLDFRINIQRQQDFIITDGLFAVSTDAEPVPLKWIAALLSSREEASTQ